MGKRSLAAVLAIALVAPGCATYSQLFIDANGDIRSCSATGQGVIGMAIASNAVDDCNKNMRAAGYMELERAGVVGLTLSDTAPGEPLRVLTVAPGAPADASGVRPGDIIVSIEGQPVSSVKDARVLLFGQAETVVHLTTRRGSQETQRGLTRVPYTVVYGQHPMRAAK